MPSVSEFMQALTQQGQNKPFSFQYDGTAFNWSGIVPQVEQKDKMHSRICYPLIPGLLQLSLDVIVYPDFPVIEWTPYLENIGTVPTGIVSEFRSLDWTTELPSVFGDARIRDWHLTSDKRVRVRYHLGSTCAGSDFLPQVRELFPLTESNHLELKCTHGRSSATFLPFLGVDLSPRSGMNLAVGWTGAWKFQADLETAEGAFQGGNKARFRIGMLDSSFRILPGERLLQPGVIVQVRKEKSVEDTQNEFRRFMIAHHSPRNAKGELQKPPICLAAWGGLESGNTIRRIRTAREKQLPYEELWIDAGWTGNDMPCPHFCEENAPCTSDWYSRVGTWRINRHAHPNGIREISDAAHEASLRMLVWFEAERIDHRSGSALLTEHRDWLLTREGEGSDLLNLGNPEARAYLTRTIGDILEQEKIDDYRQDFNIEPLPFWRAADAPDRKGVTEMKYIEGLYVFWQDLRKRFPDLIIDNCASGGRRLDYRTASLSFPLCQSDYATFRYYREECIQLENLYLDQWLPLHGTLNWGERDPYHAVSALGCGYGSKVWNFNGLEPEKDHDYDLHRKILNWGKRMRDLKLVSDVKILVDAPEQDLSRWCAQQTHDPNTGTGIVNAFRHPESPDAVQTLALAWIDPSAEYELEYFSGKTETLSGKDLAAYRAELAEPRSFLLFHYRKI